MGNICRSPTAEAYQAPVEAVQPVEKKQEHVKTYVAPVEAYQPSAETQLEQVETNAALVEVYQAPVEVVQPVETERVDTSTATIGAYQPPVEAKLEQVETNAVAAIEKAQEQIETEKAHVEVRHAADEQKKTETPMNSKA